MLDVRSAVEREKPGKEAQGWTSLGRVGQEEIFCKAEHWRKSYGGWGRAASWIPGCQASLAEGGPDTRTWGRSMGGNLKGPQEASVAGGKAGFWEILVRSWQWEGILRFWTGGCIFQRLSPAAGGRVYVRLKLKVERKDRGYSVAERGDGGLGQRWHGEGLKVKMSRIQSAIFYCICSI